MSFLNLDIASRYLFGKKSTNSINIITGISIFGISVGTAALILILSVFNGFEGLLTGLFNAFNPDLKVAPVEGKFFAYDDELLKEITAIDGIAAASATIEEIALFEYRDIQEIGYLKGIDSYYKSVTSLDTLIIDGEYATKEGRIQYGMFSIGMRNKLSINVDDKLNALTVYMPSQKKTMLGTKDFTSRNFYPAGIFSVKSDSDYQYVLSSYELASELMDKKGQASFIEIKYSPDANESAVQKELQQVLGDKLEIKDRYQQDETTLKVMQIEKWITYLLTGLTMFLIAFNLLGALWMIVLDKRKDISVLKALGYQNRQVGQLFFILGILITGIGVIVGFILALIIYYIQIKFGVVGVPSDFMTEAYPIQIRSIDFLTVSLTVFAIGALICTLPAKKAAQSLTILRGK